MMKLAGQGKVARLALILTLFLALAWPMALDGQETRGDTSMILISIKRIVDTNRTIRLPGQGRAETTGFSSESRYVALKGGSGVLLRDISTASQKS